MIRLGGLSGLFETFISLVLPWYESLSVSQYNSHEIYNLKQLMHSLRLTSGFVNPRAVIFTKAMLR